MRFSHKDFDKMIEEALGEGKLGGVQGLMDRVKERLGIKPTGVPSERLAEKPVQR